MQEEEIAEPLLHEGEAHGTAAFAEDVGAAEFPQGIQHALKIEGSVLPFHADDTHAEVAQGVGSGRDGLIAACEKEGLLGTFPQQDTR